MTTAATSIVHFAAATGGQLVDRWGYSLVQVDDPALSVLRDAAGAEGLSVTVFVGDDRSPISFSAERPSEDELVTVARLASTPISQNAAMGATSGIELVETAQAAIQGAEVRYSRRGWSRTLEALAIAVETDWASVADSFVGLHDAVIGEATIALRPMDGLDGGLPVTPPKTPHPSGLAGQAWRLLKAVGDAAAWTQLAYGVDRTSQGVRVALHADQETVVPIQPEGAKGGVELLLWRTATDDANRGEALRHVLRQASVNAPNSLPDAQTVRALAERQRIALARDNAAEVQRAISEGQKDTSQALSDATAHITDLLHGTAKASNAAIASALGVLALLGRNSVNLPTWLIVMAACAAVVGIVLYGYSSAQHLKDESARVLGTRDRLVEDPLLPDRDKETASKQFAQFDIAKRVRSARWKTYGVISIAALTVLMSAGWLVLSSATEAIQPGTGGSSSPTESISAPDKP